MRARYPGGIKQSTSLVSVPVLWNSQWALHQYPSYRLPGELGHVEDDVEGDLRDPVPVQERSHHAFDLLAQGRLAVLRVK